MAQGPLPAMAYTVMTYIVMAQGPLPAGLVAVQIKQCQPGILENLATASEDRAAGIIIIIIIRAVIDTYGIFEHVMIGRIVVSLEYKIYANMMSTYGRLDHVAELCAATSAYY